MVIDGNRLHGRKQELRVLKALVCFVMLPFVFSFFFSGKKSVQKGGSGGE